MIRGLDELIEQLSALRRAIAAGDTPAVEAMLAEAMIGREAWLAKRREADWEAEELPKNNTPTAGQMLGQMIGFGLGRRGEKKK